MTENHIVSKKGSESVCSKSWNHCYPESRGLYQTFVAYFDYHDDFTWVGVYYHLVGLSQKTTAAENNT